MKPNSEALIGGNNSGMHVFRMEWRRFIALTLNEREYLFYAVFAFYETTRMRRTFKSIRQMDPSNS
jgi:hypothetical protein